MSYYEQCDQWAYVVKPHKRGWMLTLIDGGRALDLIRFFPPGDEGHEQAIDAGQEWIWAEERGMGQSPMEAAGKVAAGRAAAAKR